MSAGGDAYQAKLACVMERHRVRVWGICYRMSGHIADADELTQEVLLRFWRQRPDLSRPAWPWLAKVATHLSIDHLRRRAKEPYSGQWLPDLVPSAPDQERAMLAKESLSMTCMVALEALTAKQRAVFLLRQFYGYSTKQCAKLLEMSEADVKTSLSRAKKRLRQTSWQVADKESKVRHNTALMRLLIAMQETKGMSLLEELLCEDVKFMSDGGGEVKTSLRTIEGRDRMMRLLWATTHKNLVISALQFVPTPFGSGLFVHLEQEASIQTPASHLWWPEVTQQGQIQAIYAVVAPSRLEIVSSKVTSVFT